jgi:hypothetical protein
VQDVQSITTASTVPVNVAPLQQLPAAFPPCPPSMHLPHSGPFRFPQSLADHPFPHGLFAHHQAVFLRQIFGDQGRPKIAVLSPYQAHHSLPHPLWQPPVRPPPCSRWITTRSPSRFLRANSFLTHQLLTCISSAALACVICFDSACFSQCSRSRSFWLISIRSTS